MEEKKGFIENSRIAIKGAVNGIFGSFIYEIILTLFFSVLVGLVVGIKNPGVGEEQLDSLANSVFDSFPFSILVSCLANIILLCVFVYIIRWEKFKELCKKAINSKTIKYGVLCGICIMFFSVLYNSSIVSIFNLKDTGNANQENVVSLINDNVLLGGLAVVILAPLVEELTYRYCIFGGVYKKNRWLAYLVAGFIFMFMHSLSSFLSYGFGKELLLDLLYLPPYLFSGLALCFAYDKSDNLGSSFIAHMLNNLISFLAVIAL